MKKSLLLGWCLVAAMAVQAQVWTAPAVPGEDLTTLGSSEVVYIYNVGAGGNGVFAIYYNGLRRIFLPLKDDTSFQYAYFSGLDRDFVNTILRNNWVRFRLREIYHAHKDKG